MSKPQIVRIVERLDRRSAHTTSYVGEQLYTARFTFLFCWDTEPCIATGNYFRLSIPSQVSSSLCSNGLIRFYSFQNFPGGGHPDLSAPLLEASSHPLDSWCAASFKAKQPIPQV